MPNETSPVKRRRRSREDMLALRQELYRILSDDHPQTVRQLYYQAVSRGLIEKTEVAYKAICRILGNMRRDGALPFPWLSDNTRWMRKPKSYSSLTSWLEESQQLYRRDIWQFQEAYIELWCEKEALSGVLVEVTRRWDVPLMVTRGYPSLSYLYSAGETIREQDRPTFLYYIGDHDPSGIDIPRCVEEGIRGFAPEAELTFKRIAVTPEQIEEYGLLTRPTKKTDSRAKTFKGESVEVDALPAKVLKALCEDSIKQHIDPWMLDRTAEVEKAELATLQQIIDVYGNGAA